MGFCRVGVVVSVPLRQGDTGNTRVVGNVDIAFYIKINRNTFTDIECFIGVFSNIDLLPVD